MILWSYLLKSLFLWFSQAVLNFSFFFLDRKTSNKVEKSFHKSIFFLIPNAINLEKAEYFKIFNLFIIILVISLLLFSIAYFLSLSTIKDSEKLSQYECGFEPFDEATRHPFDVHFYIVGILFLIFDVEIALLFPWVLGLKFFKLIRIFYYVGFFDYFNHRFFLRVTSRSFNLTT